MKLLILFNFTIVVVEWYDFFLNYKCDGLILIFNISQIKGLLLTKPLKSSQSWWIKSAEQINFKLLIFAFWLISSRQKVPSSFRHHIWMALKNSFLYINQTINKYSHQLSANSQRTTDIFKKNFCFVLCFHSMDYSLIGNINWPWNSIS